MNGGAVVSAAGGVGLVDVHTHAVSSELAVPGDGGDYAWPTVHRASGASADIYVGDRWYRTIDERCWSAQARLQDMDAEGIEVQVLSPVPVTLCHDAPSAGATSLARAQNDFLAALVDEAPGRFRALGAVPLQDPDAAASELRRCVEQLGFPGVEIGTSVGALELSAPQLSPFFDVADELSAVVLVHPIDELLDPRLAREGLAFGVGMPTETAIAAAGLLTAGTLASRPNVRMCLAHGGGALPSLLPRISCGQYLSSDSSTGLAAENTATTRASGLYCDSLTYDQASLDLAEQRFGQDHLVLGTDYPFAAREQPAGAVLGTSSSAARRTAVGRRNPETLLAPLPRLVKES